MNGREESRPDAGPKLSSPRLAALWTRIGAFGRGWRAVAAIVLALVAFQLASLDHYGLTTDSPSLFYAGDRTLFWLEHLHVPKGLDFMDAEPQGFHTAFERWPAFDDPIHYPVLPSLISAAASQLLHDRLGWVDVIAAHHVGLVLLHALGLFLFGIYACRCLGRSAGIAATLALALFPSALGHATNNAKDWSCALFYGVTLLAAGVGVIEGRGRHVLAAACFLGVSLSAKPNAAFVVPTLLVWAPIAYYALYHKRRPLPASVAGAFASAPYIAFVLFFALWPWLWHNGSAADVWSRLSEYILFMVRYGGGLHPTWTDYPVRALLFMTPPIVLIAAVAFALRGALGDRSTFARWALLTIWTSLPIIRIAAPHSNFYDANRHFLEYIPGLCAMAGAGAVGIVEWASTWLRRRSAPAWMNGVVKPAAILIGIAGIAWPVIEYHPYEVAYFNAFMGGLGGAQQKALFRTPPPHDRRANGTEGDYWSTATRDIAQELRRRVTPGEAIAVCGQPGPYLMEKNFIDSPSVRVADWWWPEYYSSRLLVLAPREGACWWREIREFESERSVVKRVERGGGLIYEILGPRDGRKYEPLSKPSLYELEPHPTDKVGLRYFEAKRIAAGRPVVKRIAPGGIVVYDVLDPATGQVAWAQPTPR